MANRERPDRPKSSCLSCRSDCVRNLRRQWNHYWLNSVAERMYGRSYGELSRAEQIQVSDAYREQQE